MPKDDFRVISFLGKGSFGQVHRVVRNSDQQEYALKEVNLRNMSQREREEAVNEIRILASLRHPNVVGYYESFIEDNTLGIVTEFATEGDLYELLKKQKKRNQYLDEETIWKYFLQLLAGLKAVHRMNILHRDLKTPNIFLSGGGTLVKIGDLGVAKHLKSHQGLASTQVGTPYYVSPEIWKHQPYDARSDVWALGCVLFEMMALRRPFEADNVQNLIKRVFSGRIPSVPAFYSRDLADVVRKMLAVNPRHRPTIDALMSMPCVTKRVHLLPDGGAELGLGTAIKQNRRGKVISTIKVPRNLRNVQLPSPCYPKWEAMQSPSEKSSSSIRTSSTDVRNLTEEFRLLQDPVSGRSGKHGRGPPRDRDIHLPQIRQPCICPNAEKPPAAPSSQSSAYRRNPITGVREPVVNFYRRNQPFAVPRANQRKPTYGGWSAAAGAPVPPSNSRVQNGVRPLRFFR